MRSKTKTKKLAIHDVNSDLKRKVPKIEHVVGAKKDAIDRTIGFICRIMGCNFRDLNRSTVLQHQFLAKWKEMQHQELSKQLLRYRIKRNMSLESDRKNNLVYSEEICLESSQLRSESEPCSSDSSSFPIFRKIIQPLNVVHS